MSAVMTGAEIVVRSLVEEGITHIFGQPGAAILSIYDALFKQKAILPVTMRHEENAVHAAMGYTRSSSQVGVAIVNSGPGVTHAVTGLATAYMDSIPLIVIAGQVDTHLIGQDAFQECDAIGITRPCVKHNLMVRDINDLASMLKKAFVIATTGRPGPVLVVLPKDILEASCAFNYPDTVDIRSYKQVEKGHSGQIRKALQLLMSAQRPVIYVGGGVISAAAAEELNALVDQLNYPCTTTLMGLGGYKASSHRNLGMPGLFGTYEANMAMSNSDVVVAIGARFDDSVIPDADQFMAKSRQIIHIDIDPSAISKRVKASIPIVGNVKDVLQEMLSQLKTIELNSDTEALAHWWKCINQWREIRCLRYNESNDLIKPQMVIETLHKVTQGNAYIVSDFGQHQLWAAQYYPFDQPRQWVVSGGLGVTGIGLPYAIGTQIAFPDQPVVYIAGEGGLQVALSELATCQQYEIYPKIIILNNHAQGLSKQWQNSHFGARYAETTGQTEPDFMMLAKAFGHIGLKATQPAEVAAVLQEGLSIKDHVVVMEFDIDPQEQVWSMGVKSQSNGDWNKEVW